MQVASTNWFTLKDCIAAHKLCSARALASCSRAVPAVRRVLGPCRATKPDSETKTKQTKEQPAKLWGRGEAPSADSKSSKRGGSEGQTPGDENNATWGLFDGSRYAQRWDVPWGPGRVAGGMALWFGSFIGVGFLLVPALYRAAGVSLYELSPEAGAPYTARNTLCSMTTVRFFQHTCHRLHQPPLLWAPPVRTPTSPMHPLPPPLPPHRTRPRSPSSAKQWRPSSLSL